MNQNNRRLHLLSFQRIKKILINLGILLISFVISLFLGEIFIRLVAPQQLIILDANIWRPDNTFGWRRNENLNTVINIGEGAVHLLTDKNGNRINRPESRKTNSQISLLNLGDSFLAALQVENEATIPQVIGEEIEKKYGKSVRAVNTGVNDWNPNHYLLQAKQSLASDKFDLGIVFIYAGNDCIYRYVESYPARKALNRHKFRFPTSFQSAEIIDAVLYPVNDFLETRSQLFIFLKTRLKTLLGRIGLTAYYFPEIYYKNEMDSKRWEVTAQICEKIKNEFDRFETPVIFVLLPAPFQVHKEEFYEYVQMFKIPEKSVDLEQPNRLLKNTFKSRDLVLLDPLDFLRENAEKGKRLYGRVDDHFNEEGHKLTALFLLPTVEKYLSNELEGGL